MANIIKFFPLILLLLSYFAVAQTDGTLQARPDREERREKVLQLNRQIFARHEDAGSGKLYSSREKVTEITSQLRDLLSEEVTNDIDAPNATATDIAGAPRAVQGDLAPSEAMSNTPFASLFEVQGIKTLAVAFALPEGGDAIPDAQPFLQFFDKTSGTWQLRASAPTISDFEGRSFFVSKLDSGASGEAWFLAWGTKLDIPALLFTPDCMRLTAPRFALFGSATIW